MIVLQDSHVLGPGVDPKVVLDEAYHHLEIVGRAALGDVRQVLLLVCLLGQRCHAVQKIIHLEQKTTKTITKEIFKLGRYFKLVDHLLMRAASTCCRDPSICNICKLHYHHCTKFT